MRNSILFCFLHPSRTNCKHLAILGGPLEISSRAICSLEQHWRKVFPFQQSRVEILKALRNVSETNLEGVHQCCPVFLCSLLLWQIGARLRFPGSFPGGPQLPWNAA